MLTSCTNDVAPEISYGLIRISVTTTGGDLDDKYQVVVGSGMIEVTANGNFTMTAQPGQATVALTGVANNCLVDGPSSATVDVPRGNTVEVQFRVTCMRTGFQISVRTGGDDLPGSYTLSMTGRAPISVAVNSSFLLSRLAPGAYSLKLESPIASCSSTSPGELSIELPPRTVVPVTFEVVCKPVVRLEKIAFQVDSAAAAGPTSYVALAKPDGTGQTLIGTGSTPSWSPGRTQLAYADTDCTGYYYYYNPCFQIIRAIDPETLNRRNLAVGSMPAWSPSDDVVAFVEQNGSLSLVTTNAVTIVRLKTPDSLVTSYPAWSPDGRTIAFTCNSRNGFSRLCVINKDGSGFHQLTDETSDPAVHPAWSHDGSTIAFASIGVAQTAIATIAPAGGAITKLAEGFDPAWSRDGTKLIFARSDGLFAMNSDGSGVERLTTGRHRAPAWRP
jgi:hypothetical protein